MSMNETELRAEVERLTAANHRLSTHLIGMSDTLQASAKEIAAKAWDEGFCDGERQGAEGDDGPKFTNPYRHSEEAA